MQISTDSEGNGLPNSEGSMALSGHVTIKPTSAGEKIYHIIATGKGGDTAQADVRVQVQGPTMLAFTSVTFKTDNDDKDKDTALDFQVEDNRTGEVIAEYHHDHSDDYFPDHSDRVKQLSKRKDIAAKDCRFMRTHIVIGTIGDDDWHFTFELNGALSNGQPFSYPSPRIELSKSNNEDFKQLPALNDQLIAPAIILKAKK